MVGFQYLWPIRKPGNWMALRLSNIWLKHPAALWKFTDFSKWSNCHKTFPEPPLQLRPVEICSSTLLPSGRLKVWHWHGLAIRFVNLTGKMMKNASICIGPKPHSGFHSPKWWPNISLPSAWHVTMSGNHSKPWSAFEWVAFKAFLQKCASWIIVTYIKIYI